MRRRQGATSGPFLPEGGIWGSRQGWRKRSGLWKLTIPSLSNCRITHGVTEKGCGPLFKARDPRQIGAFWDSLFTQHMWWVLNLIHMVSGRKDT